MFGSVLVSHAQVRNSTVTYAHLEETQFTGTGTTREGALNDLMSIIQAYGWSANPADYRVHEHSAHAYPTP